MNITALEKIAKSARILAMDAVQQANSGHPGLPLGCAELGAFLYGHALKHDPKAPDWMDRDRFILSAGHGSMFLYAHLHLAGYDLPLEELKRFRKVGSKCPGHPEYNVAPGVETTTGPLGQGIAAAAGMAIAETMLAQRFNTAAHTIFDHYTYVLSGDGCLQEGVASEAASLAGHLKLGKLIIFYDSNKITIDGSTDLSFTEDVGKRFEAYGWQVLHGDMYNWSELESLTQKAKAEKSKPSLIILKSIIGKGAPTKQGTHSVHGAPLGDAEIALAKTALGVPQEPKFWIDPAVRPYYDEWNQKLSADRAGWNKKFSEWKKENPSKADELEQFFDGKSEAIVDLPSFKKGEKIATRNASGACITAFSKAMPQLIGGSADLTAPNVSAMPADAGVYGPGNRGGRYIHFGIREFGMAAIANGLALHGGFRVFVATFLVFSDYLRPALRLSALMKAPVTYVLTHDSIFVGEDGPTHQPIEQLSALRAIPGNRVFRPADAEETAVAWKLAMEKTDGPTSIVLSRQNLPVFEKDDPEWAYAMGMGAYVVKASQGEPSLVLVASGSEVSLCIAALELVSTGKEKIRIVSMPSRELYYSQPKAVKESIIPPGAQVVVVEAGIPDGWERIARFENIVAIHRFGESGPGDEVAQHLGFTKETVAKTINAALLK